MVERTIKTDVLVIGGGMAGCFAAIKAREKGARVTLVDKGYVGRSGQSPFAGTFLLFNHDWGDDLNAWMDQVATVGEYVNHRKWTEIGFLETHDRFRDLVSWGVDFEADERGEPVRLPHPLGPCQAVRLPWRQHTEKLRKQALIAGVEIMDRVMIVELLREGGQHGGRITGALGMPVGSKDLVAFKAGATVLCAGAGGFKPPGWPIHALTSDGDAMAYRAGAAITGKEYPDPHPTTAEAPAYFGNIMRDGGPIFGPIANAEGQPVRGRGTLFLNLEFEAHAGRAPLTQKTRVGDFTRLGGGASGMSVHKAEGIWPVDTDCSTDIPGLYAAGDALGNMQSGSVYAAIGMALSSAAITGARAGWAAADYVLRSGMPEVDREELAAIQDAVLAPLRRKGGFGPRWVTQNLQNIMQPYYVMYVKSGERMEAALTLIEFLRDHLVPRLRAEDPHELRLAHETRNMVLNAEMRLRASLVRTESRGCHYREDYPRRDDENWLAWLLLKEQDGEMVTVKEPVPQEWRPDPGLSYRERYPFELPGEDERATKTDAVSGSPANRYTGGGVEG